MGLSLFINFDGDCREAISFYSKVFNSTPEGIMTYGDMPPEDGSQVAPEDKERIMYSAIPVPGGNIMLCDVSSSSSVIRGTNISPTIDSEDVDELRHIFEGLKEGGKVEMELQKTFWADLYGMVTDKYGVTWQIMV